MTTKRVLKFYLRLVFTVLNTSLGVGAKNKIRLGWPLGDRSFSTRPRVRIYGVLELEAEGMPKSEFGSKELG